MPSVPAMPKPPDARIIPLDRQTPLTHAQVEQVRFGLGDTGPLAQAVMNANIPALQKQLTIGAVSCLAARKPADPVVGQMVYETDTQLIKFWNGSAWIVPVASSVPTGSLNPFAGSAAPTGWLLCDGSAVNRVTYAALFAVTSTAYGAGDGSTTFNVPDLRGRVIVGSGTGAQQGVSSSGIITGGTALTARSVGQFFGDERTELHTHIQNSHYHTGTTGKAYTDSGPTNVVLENNAGGFIVEVIQQIGNTTASQRHQHDFTTSTVTPTNQNAFAGTGANTQPSVVTTYIIKT